MFSSSKNTSTGSRFLEIVRSLFTILILVEWYLAPLIYTITVFIVITVAEKGRVADRGRRQNDFSAPFIYLAFAYHFG